MNLGRIVLTARPLNAIKIINITLGVWPGLIWNLFWFNTSLNTDVTCCSCRCLNLDWQHARIVLYLGDGFAAKLSNLAT